ncbi:hypothetical protein F5Y17DRAFT_141906 [Xylariaceae sp. FL0594]|nr:hypothetical protein F5Y17DRAFT_141906 [Xylariaceae sp. FL0594]
MSERPTMHPAKKGREATKGREGGSDVKDQSREDDILTDLLNRCQASKAKESYKRDKEYNKKQEYLRRKWGCNDPEPEEFDPARLEAEWQARKDVKRRTRELNLVSPSREEEDDADVVPAAPPTRLSCVVQGLNITAEQPPSSESDDVSGYDYPSIIRSSPSLLSQARVKTDTPAPHLQARPWSLPQPLTNNSPLSFETNKPPRIGHGSAPPLSISAHVTGGVSYTDGRLCDDDDGCTCMHPRCPFKRLRSATGLFFPYDFDKVRNRRTEAREKEEEKRAEKLRKEVDELKRLIDEVQMGGEVESEEEWAGEEGGEEMG